MSTQGTPHSCAGCGKAIDPDAEDTIHRKTYKVVRGGVGDQDMRGPDDLYHPACEPEE